MVVESIVRDLGWSIAGIFEDRPDAVSHDQIPVLPGLIDTGFRRPAEPLIITVGSCQTRKYLAERLAGPFAIAVHPRAVAATDASIGEGSVVMQGAIIQTRTRIGSHAIINSGASVDHENWIGDYVHISPNATLCGQVSVGEGSWIGAGAVVIQGIKIGQWATVGAGAVVIRDVPDFTTVAGNPARIIKQGTAETHPPATDTGLTGKLKNDLLSIINQVRTHSGKPLVHDLSCETSLQQDLGFDSLELAELTVRIEAEFGVDVFAQGVIRTVGEIVERLQGERPQAM